MRARAHSPSRPQDVCSYADLEVVETDGEVAEMDETPALLLESTVPENAGHVLAEDVFCAFDLMLTTSSSDAQLLDANNQILLHAPPASKHARRFQEQFRAVSLRAVERAGARIASGGGQACFRSLLAGPTLCSYASAKYRGALMGFKFRAF